MIHLLVFKCLFDNLKKQLNLYDLTWISWLEYANDEITDVENPFEERQMMKVPKWRNCIGRKYQNYENPNVKSTKCRKLNFSHTLFTHTFHTHFSYTLFTCNHYITTKTAWLMWCMQLCEHIAEKPQKLCCSIFKIMWILQLRF